MKAFDFASDNIARPFIRTIQKLHTLGKYSSFVDYDLKFAQKLLKIIGIRSTSEIKFLSLSISIDGTKNPKGITMLISHKSLLRGAFPNQIIPLDRTCEDTIKRII